MEFAHCSIRNHIWVLITFVGIFSLCVPAENSVFARERRARGDIPACQNQCLSEHSKKVEAICDQYAREKDKELFQDRYNTAMEEYEDCIVGCRMVIPVK